MRIHIVTIGEPKLDYAKSGWAEYSKRLGRLQQLRTTHIPDKHNNDKHILSTVGKAFLVTLEIEGSPISSQEFADFLEAKALDGQELCFLIGGPDGLPQEVRNASNKSISFSKLTFPHDLAMVILAEALYRASSINSNLPYHR